MKRSHAVLLVVFTTTTATGCAIRGKGKNVAYVADGAAIVAGTAIAVQAHSDLERTECSSDPFTGPTCAGIAVGAYGAGMTIGLVTAAAGVVGLLVNHLLNNTVEAQPAAEQPPAAPVTGATAPALHDDCDRRISEWQTESHPVARELIRRDMGARCRARLERLTAAK